MKYLITGGTGFIGNYVVKELLSRGHEVVVTGRDKSKAKDRSWFNSVEFHKLELHNKDFTFNQLDLVGINAVIHLIWDGLPNYRELYHFEKNLMPQYLFLKYLVKKGIKNITITGTCFEYGMQEGQLSVDTIAKPNNPYGIAKDTLRKFLQQLQLKESFNLKWVRLFYMYGDGQSAKSILPQLDKALENGASVFNMSGGEQLRDYLHVGEVADILINISQNKDANGIFNACSGKPISIRNLVENHLRKKDKNISLNLGFYSYPDYEPMAFWGKK